MLTSANSEVPNEDRIPHYHSLTDLLILILMLILIAPTHLSVIKDLTNQDKVRWIVEQSSMTTPSVISSVVCKRDGAELQGSAYLVDEDQEKGGRWSHAEKRS